MTEKIRIVLIDDHTLFRSGIKALLARQENYEVVGEAADGLSGVKLVSQLAPDVVLLDLDMPVMNGREALAQILSSRPEQKVVMLTVSEDGENLVECMRLGACGFLLKNINANFLIDAISKAAKHPAQTRTRQPRAGRRVCRAAQSALARRRGTR